MKCVEPNQIPCAHDKISAIHVMPITITNFIQIRPNVVLTNKQEENSNKKNVRNLTLISRPACLCSCWAHKFTPHSL